eukprot:CAMPEP_0182563566 /NCGR_PEP_ID=MMETSP1324-20130603/5681_1 /TAXON_ID=236786 /ORGANISM="Florenciella sp., Strain RCC1587" /LENGTH=54 /DNA_ID=CAMNT_0024776799 /DNA_START=43 /DNA_END=203 /DNA_ORIENTATION=+
MSRSNRVTSTLRCQGHRTYVGELQLHLQTIIDIKEAAHRTYALMRGVGWEDDSV